jgi:hypothetical protein
MSEVTSTDNRARELLSAAGLTPTEDEIAFFETIYPVLRSKADTVYTVEQGYEA